ncbi:Hint domain-containing protein [Szabonella alba]|uniref:Hint domain-containing protein n=1 Tax=Szabonella alba TaxID=2804194 RepID=A0A8K0XZP1_9RHOB|nr:Hint domain-containing protein [Szabonella alba]MBL4917340.1 Hint domain-containing protein [Szabonella alba]
MTGHPDTASLPGQVCQVFQADDFFVSTGVNLHDSIGAPDDVCPGDVYELDPEAAPARLLLTRGGQGQSVAPGSDLGLPDEPVRLLARYTMLSQDGGTVDLLLLDLAQSGLRVLLPLSPIGMRIEYTLISLDRSPEASRLSDLLCISFARGTMITLGDGSQRAIEDLTPGDRLLTRDHGPQPLRWLGRATMRAVGSVAPVVIPRGVMGNAGDLIVSPHHRMFLYQRHRGAGIGTSELLVQAKHLVDGETIFTREGGVVDYFSLVFDRHEIIYAEGIPAESLMVTEATLSRLPPDLAQEVKARFPGLNQNQHFGTEAGRDMMDRLGHLHLRPGSRSTPRD